MKAISIWQPWASAIALGSKLTETMDWETKYRGPIAIHAGKRRVKRELITLLSQEHWQKALASLGPPHAIFPLGIPDAKCLQSWRERVIGSMPFGAIIATAFLARCQQFENLYPGEREIERLFGSFRPPPFAWGFQDVKPLANPIPYRARPGLFEVPDRLLGAAAKQREFAL